MRRFLSAAIVSLVLASAELHAQTPSQDEGIGTPRGDDSPTAWFVELASPPTIDGGTTATLDAEEARFHDAAAGAGIEYVEIDHYRHVWNGLTVETAASGETLRGLPGVVAVYPVIAASRSQVEEPPGDVADMVTALEAGRADIAQSKLGLSGSGIRVAVLDSGIDYHHPDLGGCFGPDCRVAKGWDFVGDAFNPDRTSSSFSPVPVPDPNPDDCDGHGTHVAGIIGANGTIRGVAPRVTLHAYRVFGCAGPTTTAVILAAMERAYQDGADILNMSLGAGYQWPKYPTAASAARLVKKGLIVVASGGNLGGNGMYAVDAPGIGSGVISVASFDNPASNLSSAVVSPDNRRIGYLLATGSIPAPVSGSGLLVRTGSVTSIADACAPLAPGSLTGRIALVRRGTCGFPVKAAIVQAAGAIAAVMYNNVPGRISINVAAATGPTVDIPVVSISASDGALLDAGLSAGEVEFTWTGDAFSEPQSTANLVSSFSSYGPTAELQIKPDLGAPGSAIRSTLPIERGAFGTIGGTSMAAPYVAGAIALLLEADPGLSTGAILTRLQNSARPRPWSGNPALGIRDLVHRQGAGLIAVDDAVQALVEIKPSRLALGEFDEPTGTVQSLRFRIVPSHRRYRGTHTHGPVVHEDPDCDEVTYTAGHEPAVATGEPTFNPSFFAAFATVRFSEPVIMVGRGRDEVYVNVLITPPAGSPARLFGGYLTFTPDDGGPKLRVPYLGYNGDYQRIQALTPAGSDLPWLARLEGDNLARQVDGATFTFAGGNTPLVIFHLEHQVGRLTARAVNTRTREAFLIDEQEHVGRNTTPVSFFVLSWNGTVTRSPGAQPVAVPNGTYRIELSAFKALGSRGDPTHTERWRSPDFVVQRSPQPTSLEP